MSDALSQARRQMSRASSGIGFGQESAGENESVDNPTSHANGSTRKPHQSSKSSSRFGKLPGGVNAICAFVISLVAFTIQTEAAQHVQQALAYRKPYLSLYIGHSSFLFLFPLYIVFLRFFKPSVPLSHQFHLIALNLHWQLSAPTASLPRPEADSIRRRLSSLSMRTESSADGPQADGLDAEEFDIDSLQRRRTKPPPARTTWSERRFGFNTVKLLGVFGVLTVGITVPALSWYCAVPLTTMADITTIYNTYAIWALVFSIWFLGEQWERRKVFSVLLACGGVVLVAYGGAEHRRRPREPDSSVSHLSARFVGDVWQWTASILRKRYMLDEYAERQTDDDSTPTTNAGNALLGDLLAFIGAVTMAAYEMAFKIVGTLPDEEAQRERFHGDHHHDRSSSYTHLDDGSVDNTESATLLNSHGSYDDDALETAIGSTVNGAYHKGDLNGEQSVDTERTAIWKGPDSDNGAGRTSSPSYQTMTPPVATEEDEDEAASAANKRPLLAEASREAARRRLSEDGARHVDDENADGIKSLQEWIPPPLPFGLQPIIMTSGIGFVTFFTLWIGLVIAHLLGWETFEVPSDVKIYLYLFLVAFSGIIFNGCFSILLALWGPVLASVSCLLTTVLVFLADIALGHDFRWISLLGCFSIVAGFGVLVSGGEEALH